MAQQQSQAADANAQYVQEQGHRVAAAHAANEQPLVDAYQHQRMHEYLDQQAAMQHRYDMERDHWMHTQHQLVQAREHNVYKANAADQFLQMHKWREAEVKKQQWDDELQ